MDEPAAQLREEQLAELAALADGTLPADRRAEVEARVAASAELQELLERQRQAVLATQALAAEPVPESLRTAVEADRPTRRRRRRFAPKIALAGVAAVAAAVVAAVVLSGGPGAPTVADAARLATRPATAPAPAATGGPRLALAVEGTSFPDFARAYGWHAVGVRHGRIDGRDVTVVIYAKGSRRMAYAIVSGDGLSRPADGKGTVVRGVEYQTVRLNDRLVVTWRRGGHTCVLIGDAPRAELVKLASWPLSPR